jgi:hypothetical protein
MQRPRGCEQLAPHANGGEWDEAYFYYPGLVDYQLARSYAAPQQVEPRGQVSQRERQFFRVGGDRLVAYFAAQGIVELRCTRLGEGSGQHEGKALLGRIGVETEG